MRDIHGAAGLDAALQWRTSTVLICWSRSKACALGSTSHGMLGIRRRPSVTAARMLGSCNLALSMRMVGCCLLHRRSAGTDTEAASGV